MTALTFLIVVLRYGFDMGWVAMQESVIYLHAAIFMLGAAHTLKLDEHVRVDVFYRKYSVKNKAKVNFFGGLFLITATYQFYFDHELGLCHEVLASDGGLSGGRWITHFIFIKNLYSGVCCHVIFARRFRNFEKRPNRLW